METITSRRIDWRDYLEMCKPTVVTLMLTAVLGMMLADHYLYPRPLLGGME